MKTRWKNLTYLPILLLAPSSAFGIELSAVQPAVKSAVDAANAAQRNSNSCAPAMRGQCQTCAGKLIETASTLDEEVLGALQAYGAGTSAGITTTSLAAQNGIKTGNQGTQVNGAQDANKAGTQGQAARVSAANAASKAFEKCKQGVSNAGCKGLPVEADANNLTNACSVGGSEAQKVAADNGKSGSTMGDMASMLGQAAQALGPLAQMMAGQPSPPSAPDMPSSISKPAQLASAKLSDSAARTAGGAINFGNGASTGVEKGMNAASGYAPAYEAQEFAPDPSLAESLGGTNPGSTAGSGVVSASGASSMGGGFGSKDSSGASKMGEKGAGILDPGNFEVNPGSGGGGGKPFLGLKSKSSELADLTGGDSGSGVLGEGGFDEGGRDLASSDQSGSDIHGEEGGTLFDAIRSKYSEIKKRGNI